MSADSEPVSFRPFRSRVPDLMRPPCHGVKAGTVFYSTCLACSSACKTRSNVGLPSAV